MNGDASMLHDKFKKTLTRVNDTLVKCGLFPHQDWNGILKVFIVSTGRTGTKFFAHFFNSFPGVYSVHEPYPSFLKLGIDYAQKHAGFDEAVRIINRGRQVLCHQTKRKQATIYIESNNRIFSLLRPIRNIFPDAKIVYIVRDGRDYVRSGMSRPWYSDSDSILRLRADMFSNDLYAKRWKQMTRFEKIVWRWYKKNEFLFRDVRHFDNAIKVRFEDIFIDPNHQGLFQITRFIGLSDEETRQRLDVFKDRINHTPKYIIPKWTSWDSNMKHAFDRIAAEGMKLHYNYEGME